jgi:hypothetical protein
MHRINPHQAQQGFMTIAQNIPGKNYLELAYVQAMSVKLSMSDSLYAVAVDEYTLSQIEDKHRKIFDYIILIEQDMAKDEEWKLSNEWQVFYLTPFKETIKLESDLIFTRSISHWWNTFRLKNIVLSQGCKNYLGNSSEVRNYRKVFDDNELPDIYNGLMYFRYDLESAEFFRLAEQIFTNWKYISDNLLKNSRDDKPTTDIVYALAAKIFGLEKCTIPGVDFINFVHMKPAINGFSSNDSWHNLVMCETDLPMIRINNVNQYYPVHYYFKDWVTEELVKEYEDELGRRISKSI